MSVSSIANSEQKVRYRMLGLAIILFVSSGVFQIFNQTAIQVSAGLLSLWSFIIFGLFAGLSISLSVNKIHIIWVLIFLLGTVFHNYTLAIVVFTLLIISFWLPRFLSKYNDVVLLSIAVSLLIVGAIVSSQNFYLNHSGNSILAYFTEYSLPLDYSLNELLMLAFSFLVALVLGVLIVRYEWLSNYHFKFSTLTYWAKLLLLLTVLWAALHFIGVYDFLANSFIGSIIISIDFITIQFAVSFLLLYLILYTENLRKGQFINLSLEYVGSNWPWVIGFYLLLMLTYCNFLHL